MNKTFTGIIDRRRDSLPTADIITRLQQWLRARLSLDATTHWIVENQKA